MKSRTGATWLVVHVEPAGNGSPAAGLGGPSTKSSEHPETVEARAVGRRNRLYIACSSSEPTHRIPVHGLLAPSSSPGSKRRRPSTGTRMGASIDSTGTVSLSTDSLSLMARHACTLLSPTIPDRPSVPDQISADKPALPAEPSDPCRRKREAEKAPTNPAPTRSIRGTTRSDVQVACGGSRPPGSTRGGPLTATSEQPVSTIEDTARAQSRFGGSCVMIGSRLLISATPTHPARS